MNRPRPGTAAHYANFIFRRRTLSTGQVRGRENYIAAVDALPEWLERRFPKLTGVVGVYENRRGGPMDALIFCEDALLVIDTEGARIVETLEYKEVRDWEWFSKDPVATTLSVLMDDGRRVEVPCHGTAGVVASLASFLGRASHLSDR